MKTSELAKELRGLALRLDALTYEASEALAVALELDRRRGFPQKRANRFDPLPLTVGAIAAALEAATRKPTVSVELRKDVFDRRCEKNAARFADLFEAQVKANTPAPGGTPFAPCYATADGRKAIGDAIPSFGKTPINADAHAWTTAARYVAGRIVPAYCWRELRHYAERNTPAGGSAYRLEEKVSGAVDRWLNTRTVILCDVDADGRVVRINGVDPTPFRELLAQVQAGNPDPLGILTTV